MEQVINKIIDDIISTASKKGYWAITTQRIIEITKLKPYVFHNYMMKTRKRINMPDDINVFSNDNPEDLISLLESIYGNNVESTFYKVGVFIPHKNRIEINDMLINQINFILANHQINKEDFEAMLYETDTFIEARDIYYEEEFNISKIIHDVCDNYMNGKEYVLWNLAKQNIIYYMKSLFDRNIFVKESLFYMLESRLRDFAILKNMLKGENNQNNYGSYRYKCYDNYNTKQEKKPKISKREKAKQIFQIKGEFSAITLKKRYRELMKKYHPDINPNGLEKSQQINLAYTILLSEIS